MSALSLSMSSVPAHFLLAIAIVAEVLATISLKLAEGFSKPLPLLVVGVGYLSALFLLSAVLERLPVGIVYGIWAGAGIAGVALVGVLIFEEPIGLREVAGFVLIVAGIALLSLRPAAH